MLYRVTIVNGKKWFKSKDGKKILLPHLILSGNLLKHAGISPNDKVEIKSECGLVTVKLIKNVEDNQ